MIQKCSLLRVLEVFFREPTGIHFIKEIGKQIDLAPTSVRNHVRYLMKENMIQVKKARPFDGFAANRENADFLFYKRVYNIYTLKELVETISEHYFPKAIILFGSYSIGEDREDSDIDIVVMTKTRKPVDLSKFEKSLKRRIQLMLVDDLNDLDKSVQKKVINGIVLQGGI